MRESRKIMKILKIYVRITKIMKMLEINARLIKIIRIKEMHAGNNKNYANVKNPVENQ